MGFGRLEPSSPPTDLSLVVFDLGYALAFLPVCWRFLEPRFRGKVKVSLDREFALDSLTLCMEVLEKIKRLEPTFEPWQFERTREAIREFKNITGECYQEDKEPSSSQANYLYELISEADAAVRTALIDRDDLWPWVSIGGTPGWHLCEAITPQAPQALGGGNPEAIVTALRNLASWMDKHMDPDVRAVCFPTLSSLVDEPSNKIPAEQLEAAFFVKYHDVRSIVFQIRSCMRSGLARLVRLIEKDEAKPDGLSGSLTVAKPSCSFPHIPGLEWKQVTIIFVSHTSVRIRARDLTKTYSYVEMGFADNRGPDRPNQLWSFLRILADNGGELTWDSKVSQDAKDDAKKIVQRLRKRLSTFMGIKEDPFYPYKRGQGKKPGYVTKFAIRHKAEAKD